MKICEIKPPENDKLLEECNKWVQLFLKSLRQNDIFYDAGFNWSDGSLEWDKHGTMLNYRKIKNDSSGSLTLYKDTWPFHAEQGNVGDCGLISALMTIARRQKLLEWIIPPNDYSLKHGIFLVRLFYDDKWNMLAVDGHFPCDESGEVEFASLCYGRLWPSLIEKAVAKRRGGYHKLNGTCPTTAFQYLTGASYVNVSLNKDTDLDMLWKKSFGYLMVIGTDSKPKNKKISMKGLQQDHAYALLELRVHEGHRLVLVGCPSGSKWKGKRSNLPIYKDEVMKGWSEIEKNAVKKRFSWIEIEDLCKRFDELFVCKYHEDWYEIRTGRVQVDSSKPESSSPIDHISYDFVTFENSLAFHKSLLKMIESEKCGIQIRKGLIIHEYIRDDFLVLMAENKTEGPIFMSMIAKNDEELCETHGIMTDHLWKFSKKLNPPVPDIYHFIPAKSKCVIGTVWTTSYETKLEKQPKKPEVSCKYWIRILFEEMEKKYGLDMKIPLKELKKIHYEPTLYKPIPIE
ncbi:hypothetical protein CRE_16059 [Caenorhabditis remanei]|uniref:Calpain catalytic domain-containing protein n=1 Tax=Caenorhabditis remanei TaxID=31234 RepID=E3MBL3_CAERE|nr:hypothetical protein CRE_16059 [Caenorhabditis remanei]